MKTFVNAAILIAFCIWAAAFGFVVLTASQKIPPEQKTHRTSATERDANTLKLDVPSLDETHSEKQASKRKAQEHQAADALKEFFVNFLDFKLTDFLIMVFTIVLAVKTAGLFRETARLSDAAEKQREDSLRAIKAAEASAKAAELSAIAGQTALTLAYKPMLTIQEFGLREPAGGVEQYHVHWGIRNSGQGVTVVKWMSVPTIVVERTRGTKRRITSSLRKEWLSAIEPKETVGGHSFTTATIHGRIDDIKKGILTLYVIFEIEDEDATFRETSTSRFPFVYEAQRGSFRRINMKDVDSAGGTTSTESQQKPS